MNRLLFAILLLLSFTDCQGQPQETETIQDSAQTETATSPDSATISQAQAQEPPENSSIQPMGNLPNWYNIETFGSSIAFSKIARLGKVSVFIVSVPWCGPCKTLKKQLAQQNPHPEQVDYFYVNMSAEHPFKDLKEEDAYYFTRYYDRLKEWPRVIITSPSGSILKSFSQEDLYEECLKKELFTLYLRSDSVPDLTFQDLDKSKCDKVSVLDRTLQILDRAVEHVGKFDVEKVVDGRGREIQTSLVD